MIRFTKVEAVGPYVNVFFNRETVSDASIKTVLAEKESSVKTTLAVKNSSN